jgi:hypothetical protein
MFAEDDGAGGAKVRGEGAAGAAREGGDWADSQQPLDPDPPPPLEYALPGPALALPPYPPPLSLHHQFLVPLPQTIQDPLALLQVSPDHVVPCLQSCDLLLNAKPLGELGSNGKIGLGLNHLVFCSVQHLVQGFDKDVRLVHLVHHLVKIAALVQLGQGLIVVVTGFEAVDVAIKEVDEVSHYPPPAAANVTGSTGDQIGGYGTEGIPAPVVPGILLAVFCHEILPIRLSPLPQGQSTMARSTRIVSCAGVGT